MKDELYELFGALIRLFIMLFLVWLFAAAIASALAFGAEIVFSSKTKKDNYAKCVATEANKLPANVDVVRHCSKLSGLMSL